MERAEKQAEVQFINGYLGKSQISICADYRGLTVSEITTLRKKIRKNGLNARVVKNTLAKIAVGQAYKDSDQAELGKFLELFQGPSFVMFSEQDPVASAKIAAEFAREHQNFKIKGAWFESSFVDKDGVEALSKMPSREETLARLLALISAPATQLVRLMQEPASRVVRLIAAHRDNLEKQG